MSSLLTREDCGAVARALVLPSAAFIDGTARPAASGEGDVTPPFGGYQQSGFGGRDNSIYAHDQYTELKAIWIDVADRAVADSID